MIHPNLRPSLALLIEVLKKHRIKHAFLFGSAISDKFTDQSDIDLLIDFEEGLDPLVRGELLLDLQIALEDLLHRGMELVTETSLKNPFLIEEINEKKIKLYE